MAKEETTNQPSNDEIPYEYNPLLNAFHKALQRNTADQSLWLFLDALDQLTASHNAHALAWLPAKLPAHVRLVVFAALATTVTESADLGGPIAITIQGFNDRRPAVMAALASRLDATQQLRNVHEIN